MRDVVSCSVVILLRGDSITRRIRLFGLSWEAFWSAGMIAQLACGGGNTSAKAIPYTVTVEGTSGSVHHSVTVNVSVQ